jgi:Ca-activated chloride channel family protein
VALWFRRGWTVRWLPSAALLTVLWIPAPLGTAFHWIDLFFTADQQGRRHFEKGDYAQAAESFEDIYWKGIALYRAGDFEQAVNQFALMQTPEANFYLGNCYARMESLPAAAAGYREALRLRPDFMEAEENLRLVESLIEQTKEPEKEPEEGGEPNLAPDEVQFDEKGKKGKEGEVDKALFSEEQKAEMWMRNIQTSPADFLRFKFHVQAEAAKEGARE